MYEANERNKNDPKRVDIRISDLCGAVYLFIQSQLRNEEMKKKKEKRMPSHSFRIGTLYTASLWLRSIQKCEHRKRKRHTAQQSRPPNRYGRHCETEQKNSVDIFVGIDNDGYETTLSITAAAAAVQ